MSEWIQRSCYPAIPVAAGIVLALPSLWVGIQADDWSVRSGALGAAGSATTLTRTGPNTLAVRPFGGYLRPRRWTPDGDHSEPWLSIRYLLRHLDELPRSRDHPLKLGDVIELSMASVEVTAMTDDNRPAEVTYRFRSVLENSSYRWLSFTREGYVAFTPPAIGETITVESLFE